MGAAVATADDGADELGALGATDEGDGDGDSVEIGLADGEPTTPDGARDRGWRVGCVVGACVG